MEDTKSEMKYQLENEVLRMLQRQCSVVREPEPIEFSGYLATRRFQRIDKAFQVAIHAGQVEDVESAAVVMSIINPDYEAIGLLYRASCRVLIAGRVNEALKDCDRAIKVAEPMECQNGVLITLRALRMKLSILRTDRQLEKASDCLQKARGLFSSVAPSYDSAAFLYEVIRLKLIVADKITYSDVQEDYETALRHVDGSKDLSQLFIFSNSEAEVLLKSSIIRDKRRLSPAPTEHELSKAERILNNLPINELPEKAYVYRGWHFLARSDLYTRRKQYALAKEWAEKSLEQFESGGVSYATEAPQKRLNLLKRLESH
jgi:tetratricopeptide (TPR) repeat protein